MNKRLLAFILGRILGVFGLLLGLPLAVSFIYQEPAIMPMAWSGTMALCGVLYLVLTFKKPENLTFYAREGLVLCALAWILLSLIGGLPLYFSGEYPTLFDTFFEISSGLTTTGASVATDVEALQHSTIFWRSFTHLIGGMGVLVFVLAFVPHFSKSSVQLAKAEMPGPSFGKIVSKLSESTRILYIIYFAMTAVLTILLLFGGMNLFESLCHAFGAAGTGGFGLYSNSVAHYQSPYIHWVLAIGMLAFSVNFNLYYYFLAKRFKEFFGDEELHWFLAIVLGMVALIFANILLPYLRAGSNPFQALTDVVFSVSSIISTTGYTTANYDTWPLFSKSLLLVCMIIGGCGGSTAGGFKVSRIAQTLKKAKQGLIHARQPRRVNPLHFNGQVVSPEEQKTLHGYLSIYMILMIFLLLVVSLDPAADSIETIVATVLATFNNVGPGMGAVVGPVGSYFPLSHFTKFVLSLGMIAGRLEIWPILILFSPRTWERH